MTSSVDLSQHGTVALITVDNPPVNALSQPVRAGLQAAMERALDGKNQAVVLIMFGSYQGTLRGSGWSWTNPLTVGERRKLSLRARSQRPMP